MRTFMKLGMTAATLLVAGLTSASAQDYHRSYSSYGPASSYSAPYGNYRPTTTSGYGSILPGGCRTNDWERLGGYGSYSPRYDWGNTTYSRPSYNWSRGYENRYDNRYDRVPAHSHYRDEYRGTSNRPYDRDWSGNSHRVYDVFR